MISHVNPPANSYGALMGYYQEWIDERLKWNSTSDIDYIQIPKNLIWTPHSIFYGVAEAVIYPSSDEQSVLVYRNGKVEYTHNVNVRLY